MFHIKGFDKDGWALSHAGQEPAWFGLYYNNRFLGHYVTVQDCTAAMEDHLQYPESLVGIP